LSRRRAERIDTGSEDRRAVTRSTPVSIIERAAEIALEHKAREVVSLDLQGISSATDYFLLATGTADIHVKAIADHILDALREEGVRPNHIEGLQGGHWVLLDYIDVVVHVFHPTTRQFYQLEELWGDAKRREF